jgi:chemosensory pili system protein ChpA (sensor histidine kinase/response regulator)
MKNVLVVEDDIFIRDISVIRLTDHGYEVAIAKDGMSALDQLSENEFTVVLLDLTLPDISGKDVLEKMRASIEHKNTPVIVFSNRDDDNLKKEMQQLGVSGYFVKATTDFQELFAIIDVLD